MEGCTVKLNVHLRELPNFTARPGTDRAASLRADQYAADESRSGRRALRPRGAANCRNICGASSISRACTTGRWFRRGSTCMSVFAQYVPYRFARGKLGRAPRRSAQAGAQVTGALLLNIDARGHRRAGARPAGHRAQSGTDGRAHLSGRVPAAVHVGRTGSRRARPCPVCICAAHARIRAAA